MPNLTTPIPPKLTENQAENIKQLKAWGTALIDELTYIFTHVDAGNVIEAASVKAENINTSNAQISNAQIGQLNANKLAAGTIDTNKVTVSSNNGKLHLYGSQISISDENGTRFLAGYEKNSGGFYFLLYNEDGEPTVSIDSSGNAIFTGQVESSKIYSSTIIGTDTDSYAENTGGVFAQMDPTGLRIMHDKNKKRLQKIGMSVGSDGTAYMVLGAGNGAGSHSINGVVYTNGAFKIEKNESYANLGLSGYMPQIYFWEDTQELWLNGSRVLINGEDLQTELNALKRRVSSLESEGTITTTEA